MAHSSPTAILLLLLAVCYAEIVVLRPSPSHPITDLVPRHNARIFEARDQQSATPFDEPLDLLDIVLVASVDGKLHALNRTSGDSLWTMSSPTSTSSPITPLRPLVSTQHPASYQTDSDSDQEIYIIEPQSGNIFVLASPNAPLQRLPLSMSQLMELSPYSISSEDSMKVFVGKKETSLVLLELETGRIKATLNSAECPWDPFEDLLRDREDEDLNLDLDLDELDGTRPRSVKSTSTEVFVGRTDYHVSIYTRPFDHTLPRPPPQNLSFSTYGPNNQDVSYQSLYKRTPDDTYVQAMANGKIISFQAVGADTRPLWARAYNDPIVATFDVVRSPSRAHPFVLLQPRLSLQDLFPNVDLTAAADDRLPNLQAAYIGMVEQTGSLYVMSPDHYPLVVFGDTNTLEEQHGRGAEYGVGRSAGRLIDPPASLGYDNERDFPSDMESIMRYMKRKKFREMCQRSDTSHTDQRCLVGVRKLESSRLGRLLDGSATVPLPDLPPMRDVYKGFVQPDTLFSPSSPTMGNATFRAPTSQVTVRPPIGQAFGDGTTRSTYVLRTITVVLVIVLASVLRNRRSKPPSPHSVRSTVKAVSTSMREAEAKQTATDHNSSVVAASGVGVHLPSVQLVNSPATASGPLDIEQRTTSNLNARKVSFGDALTTPPYEPGEDTNDNAAEGDDSDNDAPSIPGKKRPIRRRRGKKKPKGLAAIGVASPAGEDVDEQQRQVDVDTSPSLTTMPTPTLVTTSAPSLDVSDTVLGFGSHGTIVFKGSLQGRAVAVKRLLKDFVTLASREVSILQESDDHPNVIRYYYQESRANFLYIALELCPASLADVIERPDQFRDIAIALDPKRSLRQITSGLRHLHALKIIHRDIKPQNILISHAKKGAGEGGGHRMLISDFGLCKKLEVDQTSFYPTAHGAMAAGTVGWRAPEILRGDVAIDVAGGDESQSSRGSAYGSDVGTPTGRLTRLTKSVDIFALGCLFYYILTNGGHPFGDRYERDVNILKNAKCLDGLERFGEEGSEAVDVITKMLCSEPSERPDTITCLLHPYFWDPGKRLNFLQDASDRFEIMCRDPRDPMLVELERGASAVVGNDWNTRLDKWFIENLGKYRKYDGKSVQDLMRAMRNKKHHYQDLPDNVKRQIGTMPEGFLSYFTKRSESMFRSYFQPPE